MSADNLFGDDPALDPTLSAESRLKTLHRIRCLSYAGELVTNPPITSCDCDKVGIAAAKRNAERFAEKDEARMTDAERDMGITIVHLDRLAALEKALKDHLLLHEDDCASGGNGSDIDIDELMSRTQSLLDATTLFPQSLGGS